jgi:Co/Zn/Cd efflux system component
MPDAGRNFREKKDQAGSQLSDPLIQLILEIGEYRRQIEHESADSQPGIGMSASCCSQAAEMQRSQGFRRVLWAVLAINAGMFAVEVAAGLAAGSASLQADALDFLGDAGNYIISLLVVGMALRYRAMAAFAKGVTMGLFGLWVIGVTAWHAWHGTLPQAFTMGAVGLGALLANAMSFALLWAYREGDSNMRSAWVCTRNDVLGNLAVLLAALGVFGTGTGWPDIVVATIMAALALHGAWLVIGQSWTEMQEKPSLQPAE